MTRAFLIVTLLLAVGSGCEEAETEADPVVSAVDFDGHECAACGMIVREQPSPRGQVVHSDGTRMYFCAISDMLTYLQAPSPHGQVTHTFVELNDPGVADPVAHDAAKRPWTEASRATYVTGFERQRVMGSPVLVYESSSDAERIAGSLDGQTTDWAGLQRLSASAN